MRLRTALPALLLLAACDPTTDDEAAPRLALTDQEELAVLAFVNDPATDTELLDDDVGLDVRAARRIIEMRNGPDGEYPSGDDAPFSTLEELDRVPWVGEAALADLLAWVTENPGPAGEIVEGVQFAADEARAVTWGVTNATVEELDIDVGLSLTAAKNVAASGPYATVEEIGAVSWVGPSALERLRAYAPIWLEALASTDNAGTYDGVAFDTATAAVALEIANAATVEQLIEAGMWSTGAQRLVDGRPFAALAAVAATSGVGPATMQDLHDFAASGTWGGDEPPPTCDMTLVRVAQPSVDGYSDNMVDFDPLSDETPFRLSAFTLPGCVDTSSAAGRTALRTALITHARWGSLDPALLLDSTPLSGPAYFTGLLDDSLDHLADVRDDLLHDGAFQADAFYDAIAELYREVDDLAADGELSLRIRTDAEECTERAAIVAIPDADLAIAIHRRAGC
jgi:DNA uptake protein ComE-like DNA-binding protein